MLQNSQIMFYSSAHEAISKLLQEANVCHRCILRFCGVKQYTSYLTNDSITKELSRIQNCDVGLENSEKEHRLNDEDELPPTSKRFQPSPCPACLGLLQESCDDIVNYIEKAVTNSQHMQIKDFVLHISIPPVVDLKDKLFLLYLKEKVKSEHQLTEKDIVSVKEVCKWVAGVQYGERKSLDFSPESSFQIQIAAYYPNAIDECFILCEKCPSAFPNKGKKKKSQVDVFNRTSVLKAMESLSSNLQTLYALPPSVPSEPAIYDGVRCTRSSLHLGGRYNKYSRELSQTPWVLDGERRMESSVSEMITDVIQTRIPCDKIIFSASGREDVDVRMLGDGRPFVLEIFNPRLVEFTEEEMRSIENEINANNDAIAVNSFQIISKDQLLILKEGEEMKRKTYSAKCVIERRLTELDKEKLESLKNITILQKTPTRVLHRRTLSMREKLLHSMEMKILDDHHLLLRVETQAGTYVKEFVHGDFGRTFPSLGTLLETRADILELDVECIHLNWPPSQENGS